MTLHHFVKVFSRTGSGLAVHIEVPQTCQRAVEIGNVSPESLGLSGSEPSLTIVKNTCDVRRWDKPTGSSDSKVLLRTGSGLAVQMKRRQALQRNHPLSLDPEPTSLTPVGPSGFSSRTHQLRLMVCPLCAGQGRLRQRPVARDRRLHLRVQPWLCEHRQWDRRGCRLHGHRRMRHWSCPARTLVLVLTLHFWQTY
jgi:hypothetical protein